MRGDLTYERKEWTVNENRAGGPDGGALLYRICGVPGDLSQRKQDPHRKCVRRPFRVPPRRCLRRPFRSGRFIDR